MRVGIFFFCLLLSITEGQAQKKVIDENAYGRWNHMDSPQISNSGKWVTCWVRSAMQDENSPSYRKPFVRIFNTTANSFFDIKNVQSAFIMENEKYLLYKPDGKMSGAKGQDSCILLDLVTGERKVWTREASCYSLWGTDYLFYDQNMPRIGTELMSKRVFLNIRTNDSSRIDSLDRIISYYHHKQYVFYSKWNADSTRSLWYGKIMGKQQRIDEEMEGIYVRYMLRNEDTDKVILYRASDKKYMNQPDLIYELDLSSGKCRLMLDWKQIRLPEGYCLPSNLSMTGKHNEYVYAELKAEKDTLKNRKEKQSDVSLELWRWDDEVIPSMKKEGREDDLRQYVYNMKSGKWICLNDVPGNAVIRSLSSGDYVLRMDYRPYRLAANWTERVCGDLYLIDLQTGTERLIDKGLWEVPTWSPNGECAIVYQEDKKEWYVLKCRSGEWISISEKIPYAVYQEDYDYPRNPPAYGFAAWSEDGKAVIVYDRYDIWLVELSGQQKTTCLTSGYGRKHLQKMRIEFYGENRLMNGFRHSVLNLKNDVLIRGVNEQTRAESYYFLKSNGKLVKLMEGDARYQFFGYSGNGKKCIWRKMNYREYFDLWCSNRDFTTPIRVIETNPQQKEYRWGDTKLLTWSTLKGKQTQGVLYLPEGYDSTKTYPVIVCIYEKHTNKVHEYQVPDYSRNTINIPTYVSRGYVVFRPDIHYRVGEPGESCYDAVVSGVNLLIKKGIADKHRIGLQGHSWGGFQVAYLITHTDLFRCAQIGAGVVNAVSAYTAMRGNGSPRMFMYELTQSRLGKTLWDDSRLYLESSPILLADRIVTPLLILHNDGDEAVPYSQGLDLYFAMRRLQKPAWLFNYKGERHVLRSLKARRDWTIRMQQFFDYYLKETKKPEWMEDDATEKGKMI